MKKQHIFIIMILAILYISYLILSFLYKENKINNNIEYIHALTVDIEKQIETAKNIIEYKTSRAYKNKILKEQQSYKNKWEKVIYLTTEEEFNKYTKKEEYSVESKNYISKSSDTVNIERMTNYERWVYFIFSKDISNL